MDAGVQWDEFTRARKNPTVCAKARGHNMSSQVTWVIISGPVTVSAYLTTIVSTSL